MNERVKNFVWIVVVIAAFSIFSITRGGTYTYLDFGEEALTVSAPENYTYIINYDDITDLELVDEFDPGTMLSGGETRKYRWGSWKNDAWGEYVLCSSKRIDNALLVTNANGTTLALNYESEKTTEALLGLLTNLIEN